LREEEEVEGTLYRLKPKPTGPVRCSVGNPATSVLDGETYALLPGGAPPASLFAAAG